MFLNDHLDLDDMIGSFASGATASPVAKNGKKYSSIVDRNIKSGKIFVFKVTKQLSWH